MRTVMRPRYYCDYCNKGSGSPSAMRRHERGCTANANRVCGMCIRANKDVGFPVSPPRDELVAVMDSQGFEAMCRTANQCPACILSVLRTKNYVDEFNGLRVAGSDDGREDWSFSQAKRLWWESVSNAAYARDAA